MIIFHIAMPCTQTADPFLSARVALPLAGSPARRKNSRDRCAPTGDDGLLGQLGEAKHTPCAKELLRKTTTQSAMTKRRIRNRISQK